MNTIPKTPATDKLGTGSSQWAEVNATIIKINGTEAAKVTRPVDTFGAPTDNTDGDATTLKHGFMPKSSVVKLATIAEGAQVNPSNAAIAAAYASEVPQISAPEIAAGSGTTPRRVAPADITAMIAAHGAAGTDAAAVVAAVSSATADTDTIVKTLAAGVLTYVLKIKTSGLSNGSQGEIGKDSSGAFTKLGTTSTTAAAGDDARFVTTDQKAAIAASDSPAAGNPMMTLTGAKTIALDTFAATTDITANDATASKHGFMPKADFIKLAAIEAGAQVNLSAAALKSAYEGNADTNAFTDTEKSKLAGIATGSQVNPSDAAIAASYATQVAQISALEKANPVSTSIRRFSPKDVADMGTNMPFIHLIDSKTSGTNGGSAAATTWETRALAEFSDTADICTVASNQFTLPAGTYDIEGWAKGYQVNAFALRLFNVTATAVVAEVVGAPARADAALNVNVNATLEGKFTIASSATFSLQQYCNTAKATTGFGVAGSITGVAEIFSSVKIYKRA